VWCWRAASGRGLGIVAGRSTSSLAFMARALAIGLFLALLSGCFPYVSSYVHLDAPGIKHLSSFCGVGPPAIATFESHGARFDVTLEPRAGAISKAGYLRLRVPQQSDVSIPNPTAHFIHGEGASQRELRIDLVRAAHPENRHGAELMLGRGLVDHYFDFVGLPPISHPGSLRLPTVKLNGLAVTPPTFTFELRPFATIAPLNC
jgi:hypothetical protein